MNMAMVVAIIVGISQVMKNVGLPTKYIPLINLILGVGLSFLVLTGSSIQDIILQGLIVGLSAGGLYDQSKGISVPTDKEIKQ